MPHAVTAGAVTEAAKFAPPPPAKILPLGWMTRCFIIPLFDGDAATFPPRSRSLRSPLAPRRQCDVWILGIGVICAHIIIYFSVSIENDGKIEGQRHYEWRRRQDMPCRCAGCRHFHAKNSDISFICLTIDFGYWWRHLCLKKASPVISRFSPVTALETDDSAATRASLIRKEKLAPLNLKYDATALFHFSPLAAATRPHIIATAAFRRFSMTFIYIDFQTRFWFLHIYVITYSRKMFMILLPRLIWLP